MAAPRRPHLAPAPADRTLRVALKAAVTRDRAAPRPAVAVALLAGVAAEVLRQTVVDQAVAVREMAVHRAVVAQGMVARQGAAESRAETVQEVAEERAQTAEPAVQETVARRAPGELRGQRVPAAPSSRAGST